MISEVSTQLLWPSLSLQTRNLKLLKESLAIGVLIDLKKAIDSIKNSIVLDKLNFYGVRGTSLSWFQDDLNSRCQFLEQPTVDLPSKLSNVASLRALCWGHSFFSNTLMTSLHLLPYFPSSSLLLSPPSFFSIIILQIQHC